MDSQAYLEVVGVKGSDSGPYRWKVYGFDHTDRNEVLKARSSCSFQSWNDALEDGQIWCEQNGIDVMMVL